MSRIPFVKAHACGNDFLIIEESLAQGKHSALARKLCSRNTGIGADGIEFLRTQTPNGQLLPPPLQRRRLRGRAQRQRHPLRRRLAGRQRGPPRSRARHPRRPPHLPPHPPRRRRLLDRKQHGRPPRHAPHHRNPRRRRPHSRRAWSTWATPTSSSSRRPKTSAATASPGNSSAQRSPSTNSSPTAPT